MNYMRALKEADPKFAAKLEKVDNGYIDSDGQLSACWEYTGSKFTNGYGRVYGNTGESKAHRHSFALTKGKIGKRNGKSLMVLHKCDIRSCCNPKHLYRGNHRKNMQDMTDRKRQARGETSGVSVHKTAEVAFAKLLLDVGFSYTDVQDMMLLSRSTVGRFAKDTTWVEVLPMKRNKSLIKAYIEENGVRAPHTREVHGWNAQSKPLSVRCVRELVSVYGQVETALMLGSTRKVIRMMLEKSDSITYQVNPLSKNIVQTDPNLKVRRFILDSIG